MTSTRIRTTILVVLASSVLAVLAFGPGLRGAFLNFDDPRTVLENPAFLEGGVAGFERIFDPTSTIADVYLPVTYTSLWIDHALTRWSGANPLVHTWIYHAQSLLWHVVAALLLFAILTTLRLGRTLAFAATALFLVHPALAESVVWISSRKDVLSGALAFACFFFGQRVVLRNASLWPVAISAVLACYAKATAIVIPLVGALLWLATAKVARDAAGVPVSSAGESAGESETSTTVLDGARRRVAACVLVSLVIAVLAGVHHLYLAAQAGTAAFDAEARVVPGTFLHYLRVALWPDDLAVHRPRGLQDSFSQDAELRALWLLVLLAAAAVCWRRGKHEVRLVGIGLLAFFAALLPFNGFKPAFAVAAADRYLYLALPGLALVFAAGGAALEQQLARVLRPVVVRRIVGLVVVGGLLVAALVRTRARTLDFTSSERLWEANLTIYPDDDVGLVNLAEWFFLVDAGEVGAGERDPQSTHANRRDRAEALLEHAARHVEDPVRAMRVAAQRMRAALLRDDLAAARLHLETAIDIADDHGRRFERARVELRLQLVDVLDRLGRDEALDAVLEEVLRIAPDHGPALARKAEVLLAAARSGAKTLPLPQDHAELVRAGGLLTRAFRDPAAPTSAIAIAAKAEWHRLRGETSAASRVLDSYRGAVHERIVLGRATIYEAEGLFDEAIAELERALPLLGASLKVPQHLAELYLQTRRSAAAETLLEALVRSFPRHERISTTYGHALIERAREMVAKHPVDDYRERVLKARRLAPLAPRLALLDALVFEAEGRYDEALVRVRSARESEADSQQVEQAYLGLLKRCAWLALATGRGERAYALFREVLAAAPPGYDVAAVREALQGEVDRRLEAASKPMLERRFADARRACLSVLELDEANASALVQLGLADFALEDFRAAESHLARGIKEAQRKSIDPGLAVFYRMRALLALDRKGEALEVGKLYLSESSTRTSTEASTEVSTDAELRTRITAMIDEIGRG